MVAGIHRFWVGGDFISHVSNACRMGYRRGDQAADLSAMPKVARVCALWTLAAGAVVLAVRYWKFEHRWFILTGAALLHVALHGLAGVSYLSAGAISLAVAALIMATMRLLRPKRE